MYGKGSLIDLFWCRNFSPVQFVEQFNTFVSFSVIDLLESENASERSDEKISAETFSKNSNSSSKNVKGTPVPNSLPRVRVSIISCYIMMKGKLEIC